MGREDERKVTEVPKRGEKQQNCPSWVWWAPRVKIRGWGREQLPLGWGVLGTPSLASFPSICTGGLSLTATPSVIDTCPQPPKQGYRPDLSFEIKACQVPWQSSASPTSFSHWPSTLFI